MSTRKRIAIVVASIVVVSACAGASGYDASRYENAPGSTSTSVNPETEALPRTTKRQYMVDPRRPIAIASAQDGGDATAVTSQTR